MNAKSGWEPSITLPLVRLISCLTQRSGSVCELSTSVYVSAAMVSRNFCFGGIALKSFTDANFASMNGIYTP